MKATVMVLEGPRHFARRRFDLPDVGDDDAILRVEACGLCGTDHEQFTGTLPAGFSFVPGHETVGVVEAVGARAAERWGVRPGTRVAVGVFQTCGGCQACTGGHYQRCTSHGMSDMYGFVPVDRPPGLWGGYASHQYLAPDSLVLPLPDSIDPVVATLFNPLGAGFRWAAAVAGTRPGDTVAVLGCGIRGLSALVAAREAGAGFVAVTGRGGRDRPRLEVARDFGADLVIDVERADPVAELVAATGRLADVVVDVTAKAPEALGQAVSLAAAGGTVVVAGTRGPAETPGFRPDDLVYKELRLEGALGVDASAYRRAIDLLLTPRYPFGEIPRRVVHLGGVAALLASMAGEGKDAPPLHGVVVP